MAITDVFRTFGAVVTRQDKDAADGGATWTAAERNVRVPVGVFPQDAPDPIRYGATPSRPARVPIVTFSYDMNAWESDGAVATNLDYDPLATPPPGWQDAWGERANMAPPQHIAYGSLFTYQQTPYGIG